MDRSPGQYTLNDADRQVIGLWVADCAEQVLPLFEARAPSDRRPREAIEGIRAFARGELRKAPLRALFSAAYAAAREVDDRAAAAAARAAGLAASSAFTHSTVTVMGTAGHIVGPGAYAALARELDAHDSAAADEEIRWALEHASPALRRIMRRIPAIEPGQGRLDTLLYRVDSGLRGQG